MNDAEQRIAVLREAVALACQGYSVFPLASGSKRPAADWACHQGCRTPPEEVFHWPACNVAVATGSVSGVVVVDCESEEDAKWFATTVHNSPCVARTPRGFHLYFRHPGGSVGNRAKVKVDGRVRFDIRGDGGYVVAPPSRVSPQADRAVKTPGSYSWLRGPEPAHKLPVFNPDWAPEPPAPKPIAVAPVYGDRGKLLNDAERYAGRVRAVSGEGGHNDTFRLANWLRRKGLTPDEAWSVLCGWNRTNADPPWAEYELRHKLEDAYRAT